MTTEQICAYLAPENIESFWQWSDGLETVTWWNGETIAFHEEIDACIRHLKPHGLPAFPEMILVLAACRKNWRESNGGKSLFATYLQSLDENPLPGNTGNVIADWVRPLLNGLDKVNELFNEKPGLERKQTILEVLFEDDGHNLSALQADRLSRSMGSSEVATGLADRIEKAEFNSEGNYILKAPFTGLMERDLMSDWKFIKAGCDYGLITDPSGESFYFKPEVSGEMVTCLCNSHMTNVTAGVEIGTVKITRTPTLTFVQTIRNLLEVLPVLQKIDSLESREKTGLDSLPLPAEEAAGDLPDAVAARNLIRELIDDPEETELSGIARVARDLLGMLNVPRDVSDPEDMPLGGFSDIANKGDLDRLLLTELAQDDEVLAVRVALNEALYLRRESPPKQPPRERRLFIDNGIRLWGIPRAFAHSAALALAASIEVADSAHVFSSDTDFSQPDNSVLLRADFRSREGLGDALARLAPGSHPTAHVTEFLDSAKDAEDCDRILITHPRVLTEPAFINQVHRAAEKSPLFILTIDTVGELILLLMTGGGTRELRRIKLDLDRLMANPTGSKNQSSSYRPGKRKHNADPSLPAILAFEHFPLRLAHPLQEDHCWISDDGDVITMTSDGLLLHYRNPNQGAILLSDSRPTHGICTFGTIDTDLRKLILVFGNGKDIRIVTIDLDSHEQTIFEESLTWDNQFTVYYKGHVILLTGVEAIKYSIQQGQVVDQTLLDRNLERVVGRFVRMSGEWYALSVSPGLEFSKIELTGHRSIKAVFECPQFDEPLALLESGQVYRVDGDENPVVPFTSEGLPRVREFHSITNGGSRVSYHTVTSHPKYVTLDFDAGIASKQNSVTALRDPCYNEVFRLVPTLRKNFKGVSISLTAIGLVPARGTIEQEILLIADSHFKLVPGIGQYQKFDFETVKVEATGYTLKVAELEDGSTVFLDSRGMVHLKSSSSRVPDLTFILRDQGILSGWASTGEFFGAGYFIGENEATPAKQIAEYLEQFRLNASAFYDPISNVH